MRKTGIILVFVAVAVLVSVTYHLTQQEKIHYHQGHRFFVEGRYPPAIPFFEKTLEISPDNKEAILELGYSYLWTGGPEQSIPLLLKSVENYPNDEKVLLGLADAYSWSGQYDEAIVILRQKILESGDIMLKKKLAEIYLWNGKFVDAQNILTPILKRDPEDADALFLMGKALYYSGDSLKASEALEKLLEGMNEK